MTATQDSRETELEALISYLKWNRGFDFSGYKRASLARRISARMESLGIERYGDYQDFLEVHPDEFAELFDTILINVTRFFRDPEAWQALASEVLPGLLRAADPGQVRVWSAGCASGEEAYSIAMLLAEALGPDRFIESVKIYGTDADEQALRKARAATYSRREVAGVPRDLLQRYFETNGSEFTFRKEFRHNVIFGRNDLVQDAPISRLDLLLCRNTLIYLNAETQARILSRFFFALREHGALFLGKAEMLISHPDLFTPIDLRRRIFRRASRPLLDRAVLPIPVPPHEQLPGAPGNLSRLAFEADPTAQLVVDGNGDLVLANRTARTLFGIREADYGRPFRDLEVSYRPAELRSLIADVIRERRVLTLPGVSWNEGGRSRAWVEISILPLLDTTGQVMAVRIRLEDITATRQLTEQLAQSKQELEAAYEELQSTNEELETMNEELQSTVEEMETTNEELQSSNEEMETMNEELQSTNEELETMNRALRERTTELDRVNVFLQTILGSLRAAVIVVDRGLRVRVWNTAAQDLWGLTAGEALGQDVGSLDIGLPTGPLVPAVRSVMAQEQPMLELDLEAVDRRGRSIRCKVGILPLAGAPDRIDGAILMVNQG